MDLKNKKEQLSAQEVELLNDFQMEELEERMEMRSWFKNGVEVEAEIKAEIVEPANGAQTPVQATGGIKVTF